MECPHRNNRQTVVGTTNAREVNCALLRRSLSSATENSKALCCFWFLVEIQMCKQRGRMWQEAVNPSQPLIQSAQRKPSRPSPAAVLGLYLQWHAAVWAQCARRNSSIQTLIIRNLSALPISYRDVINHSDAVHISVLMLPSVFVLSPSSSYLSCCPSAPLQLSHAV